VLFKALAVLTALSHLSFIVFLVVGGFIGKRRAKVRVAHLWAIGITLTINLTGSACPLTVIEKGFIRRGGRAPYESGFISHYLVEPVHPAGVDGTVNLILLLGFLLPIALAYFLGGPEQS